MIWIHNVRMSLLNITTCSPDNMKSGICASCGANVRSGRVFFDHYFCNESCETKWMESDTGKEFLESEQERQEARYIDWYPGN